MGDELELEEILERLGQLVDKAENYLAMQVIPVPPTMLIDSLKTGLEDVRDEIKTLYFRLGGDNVWVN